MAVSFGLKVGQRFIYRAVIDLLPPTMRMSERQDAENAK
jgi:hypothetical protein